MVCTYRGSEMTFFKDVEGGRNIIGQILIEAISANKDTTGKGLSKGAE